MAINLSRKDLKQIDQIYALGSLTKSAFGAKFDFTSSKSVRVFNFVSQPLGDYSRTGTSRYGTMNELQDTVAEYIVTKDRAFSTSIDKGNYIQGNLLKTAGAYIKVEMDEQVTPEMDTYNLATLYASATTASQVTTVAVTASNAYSTFLALQEKLDDAKVPVSGRIAFVKASYYNFLKLDGSFTLASDMAMKNLINGQVGDVDGVKIVKVPSSYFPTNVNVIITHPSANVNPMQIESIRTHEDPVGVSGTVIEGRFVYDAFTMANKIKACAANKIL